MFFHNDDLRLRMVGFEGDPVAAEHMRQEFNRTGGRFELRDDDMRSRVSMAYEYVNVRTIVRALKRFRVPRDFLLLKIDIDSFDFHVFSEIVHHFRPLLVWVEKFGFPWRGNPQRFAALGALPNQTQPPLYHWNMGFFDALQHFTCAGSSPAMWVEHGPRLGYEVLLGDGRAGKNLLLVPSNRRSTLPAASSNLSCFWSIPEKHARQRWSKTLWQIDLACNASRTPYTVELDGVCCPHEVGGNETGLQQSQWCRCDVIRWKSEEGHGGGEVAVHRRAAAPSRQEDDQQGRPRSPWTA